MKLHFLLAVALPFAAVHAFAATPVYKWVDKNGTTHYSAEPHGASAKRLAISDSKLGNGTKPDAKETAKLKQCKQAKDQLAAAKKAVLLYRTDANGKRHVLSKQEQDAFVKQIEARVGTLCLPGEKQ